ncbi:hypothetical protein R50072_23380 [Simiduia litorea]|uniref:autotransporter outer membrane beta-barrel domain-containing protein n=1 Tax=Simiduia litorea TaxID=1435348 RepID=UPI0036F362B6
MKTTTAILHVTTLTLGAALSASTLADLSDLQGQFQSELEELAAITNQNTYDELKQQGCNDQDREPTESCTASTFLVWQNVRELVHTANELIDSGPTQFSLDLDLEGLGFSLRWTAGEEFSSQESMTNSFAGGQLSNLSSRITALRSGASGFSIANWTNPQQNNIAMSSGLNAGDDINASDAWSRWGGFLNGSYTYGNQDPTQREDAFDFDGSDINGGVDYRINDNWVVGGLIGYQTQEINFDSSLSIVDGGVNMDGWSILPFVLYQDEHWFTNLSAGYQKSDFDTERSIRYPSLNPNVGSVNTVAISSNSASTWLANWAGGYSFSITDAFTIEPSVGVNYQHVSISDYTEKDLQNDGFNFLVLEQTIKSLETVFSLKAQYVFSTSYGVFLPYVNLQSFSQQETDDRYIDAIYANASSVITDNARFSLPTNTPDSDYKIYGIGLAAVLRGASQKTLDAPASGGIQAFLNYREIIDVGDYSQKIIAGGIRYEF